MNYPVNEQVIIQEYQYVNTGLFGKGFPVSLMIFGVSCTDKKCKHADEHVAFDGQIFHKGIKERKGAA